METKGIDGASSEIPPMVLRYDLLQEGDVLLTRAYGLESKKISAWSGGQFSHAAIVVNQGMLFESDGEIIGYRAIRWLGYGEVAGQPTALGCLFTNPRNMAVYRHPMLKELPPGTFNAAIRGEMEVSYGRNYSELYRLASLAKLPAAGRQILAAALKIYERRTLAKNIPGPFCSELVARLYARLGLELFSPSRPSEKVTPNDLATSNLSQVSDAVVSSAGVRDFRPELVKNLAETFSPRSGDRIAASYNADLQLRRVLDASEELSLRMRESTRSQVEALWHSFPEKIQRVCQLLDDESAPASERMVHWLSRLRDEYIELSPTFAALSEDVSDKDRLSAASKKFSSLTSSLVRCHIIRSSQILRRASREKKYFFKWSKTHRARKNLLLGGRSFLQSSSVLNSFIAKELLD